MSFQYCIPDSPKTFGITAWEESDSYKAFGSVRGFRASVGTNDGSASIELSEALTSGGTKLSMTSGFSYTLADGDNVLDLSDAEGFTIATQGSGANTITLGAKANTINLGSSGVDTVVLNASASSTISGLGSNDVLDLSGIRASGATAFYNADGRGENAVVLSEGGVYSLTYTGEDGSAGAVAGLDDDDVAGLFGNGGDSTFVLKSVGTVFVSLVGSDGTAVYSVDTTGETASAAKIAYVEGKTAALTASQVNTSAGTLMTAVVPALEGEDSIVVENVDGGDGKVGQVTLTFNTALDKDSIEADGFAVKAGTSEGTKPATASVNGNVVTLTMGSAFGSGLTISVSVAEGALTSSEGLTNSEIAVSGEMPVSEGAFSFTLGEDGTTIVASGTVGDGAATLDLETGAWSGGEESGSLGDNFTNATSIDLTDSSVSGGITLSNVPSGITKISSNDKNQVTVGLSGSAASPLTIEGATDPAKVIFNGTLTGGKITGSFTLQSGDSSLAITAGSVELSSTATTIDTGSVDSVLTGSLTDLFSGADSLVVAGAGNLDLSAVTTLPATIAFEKETNQSVTMTASQFNALTNNITDAESGDTIVIKDPTSAINASALAHAGAAAVSVGSATAVVLNADATAAPTVLPSGEEAIATLTINGSGDLDLSGITTLPATIAFETGTNQSITMTAAQFNALTNDITGAESGDTIVIKDPTTAINASALKHAGSAAVSIGKETTLKVNADDTENAWAPTALPDGVTTLTVLGTGGVDLSEATLPNGFALAFEGEDAHHVSMKKGQYATVKENITGTATDEIILSDCSGVDNTTFDANWVPDGTNLTVHNGYTLNLGEGNDWYQPAGEANSMSAIRITSSTSASIAGGDGADYLTYARKIYTGDVDGNDTIGLKVSNVQAAKELIFCDLYDKKGDELVKTSSQYVVDDAAETLQNANVVSASAYYGEGSANRPTDAPISEMDVYMSKGVKDTIVLMNGQSDKGMYAASTINVHNMGAEDNVLLVNISGKYDAAVKNSGAYTGKGYEQTALINFKDADETLTDDLDASDGSATAYIAASGAEDGALVYNAANHSLTINWGNIATALGRNNGQDVSGTASTVVIGKNGLVNNNGEGANEEYTAGESWAELASDVGNKKTVFNFDAADDVDVENAYLEVHLVGARTLNPEDDFGFENGVTNSDAS